MSMSKRLTARAITSYKGVKPVVCLTAYHAHTARLIDPHVDLMLVGDSMGMVMYGMENTLGVTLEMMTAHGGAVVRGSQHALVVVDMPFGSYEESLAQAFANAAHLIKETACGAVKLEGGCSMAATIAHLTERGIPVMAHVGMTPQHVKSRGGFQPVGLTSEEWPAIEADARAVAEAGAFAVVLECVAEPLARRITQNIAIPTIGIGASSACDGQILVTEDLLGLSPRPPRFVREYASLAEEITQAVRDYARDVQSRSFPGKDNVYLLKDSKRVSSEEGIV